MAFVINICEYWIFFLINQLLLIYMRNTRKYWNVMLHRFYFHIFQLANPCATNEMFLQQDIFITFLLLFIRSFASLILLALFLYSLFSCSIRTMHSVYAAFPRRFQLWEKQFGTIHLTENPCLAYTQFFICRKHFTIFYATQTHARTAHPYTMYTNIIKNKSSFSNTQTHTHTHRAHTEHIHCVPMSCTNLSEPVNKTFLHKHT